MTQISNILNKTDITLVYALTLLSAVVSDSYIEKCSVPSRSNLPSVLSARVPECQKLKMIG